MTDWTPTGADDDLDTILRGEYACTRVWEAWQIGTMTVDDFTPMVETEIVGDLLAWRDAAVKAALARAVQQFRDNPMWATATSWDDAMEAAEWFAGLVTNPLNDNPNGSDHG
jgi:hypothetical protein